MTGIDGKVVAITAPAAASAGRRRSSWPDEAQESCSERDELTSGSFGARD
jgi:hypothetical protein